jgi:hypothetical protein
MILEEGQEKNIQGSTWNLWRQPALRLISLVLPHDSPDFDWQVIKSF